MPEERAHDLAEALAEVARETGGGTDHPSDDELLAYRDGDLDPASEERVQDHLAGCRRCADGFLDLDALCPDPGAAEGADVEPSADLAAETMWRELRAELAARPAGGSRDGKRRVLAVLAAGLALAVVGLGVWVDQLQRRVDRLTAPRVNPPVLYLDEPVRGREAEVPGLPAPAGDDAVLLIVTPPPAGEGAGYRAVLARRGEEVWRGDGLALSEAGTLRLRLPARLLRPGAYELRIATPGAGEPTPALYRFDVLPEARGPT